ncbi:MAG: GNAT family N-acetyltransferase [Pseudomonadota bacterium]
MPVLPEWARLSRALMAEMLAIARAAGCAEAWVATEGDNAPARALYRAAGGAETERIVLYEWRSTAPG